ncbi:hypothetical protein AU825_08210 [Salmonella enterica subsp. salamae]|nr:hypothetical protein [Salmonella enterica subsp. salamae]ECF6091475.1 hypothetical protein [Salmonella enterica subsp. salamae]EDW5990935.1 hypothetical protein [Salmonella enterica subsp. salamae]
MFKSLARFFSGGGIILLPVILFILLTAVGSLFYLIFGDAFFNTLFGPVGVMLLVAVMLFTCYGVSALMNLPHEEKHTASSHRPVPGGRRKSTMCHSAPAYGKSISVPPPTASYQPLWKKALKGMVIVGSMLIPFLGMPGIILFICLLIIVSMLPHAQSRFMRYQQILPTSKVRSMATGIVELEGRLLAQKQIQAPLSGQRCIGYYHTIEREEQESDGKTHYRLIHEEKRCQPFQLQDDTGSVSVDVERLDFHLLATNKMVRRGDEIAKEYLLTRETTYLMIGQAARRNGELVLTRDRFRRVFGIAPINNLQRRSKLDALFGRARYFIVVTAMTIALLLVMPIEVQHRQVIIHFTQLLPFASSQPASGIIQ